MVLFRSKNRFRTGRYHDTIPPRKSIFEFVLRARKITILGALATQFHAKCGLEFLSTAAQLGYAKIALALLLRVIFFKNHSRRVYVPARALSQKYF
jgi:hypothetical protein